MTETQTSVVERLARRLATLADVTDVIVITDPAQDGTHSYTDPCTGTSRIIIGAHADTRMAGALAHEIAHFALGHTLRPRPSYAINRWSAYTAVGAFLAAVYVPALTTLGLRVAAVALAISFVAYLLAMAGERRDEFDADRYAVDELNNLGIDGRSAVSGFLACGDPYPWWYRAGGWLLHTYPTRTARIRRIRAISPSKDEPAR